MNIFNSQGHMLLCFTEHGAKRSFLNNTQCGSHCQAHREGAQSWMCPHSKRIEKSLDFERDYQLRWIKEENIGRKRGLFWLSVVIIISMLDLFCESVKENALS